jgi:hypothetical protein
MFMQRGLSAPCTMSMRGAPHAPRWACSAVQSDVSEAITLLLAAARFGVAGAPAALRRMLPLVFSREQSARPAPERTKNRQLSGACRCAGEELPVCDGAPRLRPANALPRLPGGRRPPLRALPARLCCQGPGPRAQPSGTRLLTRWTSCTWRAGRRRRPRSA